MDFSKERYTTLPSQKDFQNICKILTECGLDVSILYVEPDTHFIEEIKPSLMQYFRDCDFVNSGEDALAKLQTRCYDILVVNLILPKMNGMNFIIKARKLNHYQHLIVTTEHHIYQATFDLINIGLSGYILKPFSLQTLLLQLSRITNQTYENKMFMRYIVELEEEIQELRRTTQEFLQPSIITPLKTVETNDVFFEDDTFFDFDDQSMDLEHLHVKDNYKISAQELFTQGLFDLYCAQDIIDSSKALLELPYIYESLTVYYLEEVMKRIQVFAANLRTSAEFINLADALYTFDKSLEKLSTQFHARSENNILFKQFIDAVLLDLTNWTSEILIEKCANDIHYLDASLLSSIVTIHSMIEQK